MKISQMEKWIDAELNVLFVGEHGVGKTAMVKEAFENKGLKWKYFSASTMDPWVDFIGVPKEKVREDGVSVLELVRPLDFAYDNVEALFFDEFNRSSKKIRNAVMELIQFKSINGKKFNNLKIVWAAINPDDEDETYDVDKLDPAQLDRFHLRVDVPSNPSKSYFSNRYGKFGKSMIQWYSEQPKEVKKEISPRRLDYIADVTIKDPDSIEYVVPKGANIKKLLEYYSKSLIGDDFESFEKGDTAFKTNFLANYDNVEKAKTYYGNKYQKWAPYVSDDHLIGMVSKDVNLAAYVVNNAELFSKKKGKQEILESCKNSLESLAVSSKCVYKFTKKNKLYYYTKPSDSHLNDGNAVEYVHSMVDNSVRSYLSNYKWVVKSEHSIKQYLSTFNEVLAKTRITTWQNSTNTPAGKNLYIDNLNNCICSFMIKENIDMKNIEEVKNNLIGKNYSCFPDFNRTNMGKLIEFLNYTNSTVPAFVCVGKDVPVSGDLIKRYEDYIVNKLKMSIVDAK